MKTAVVFKWTRDPQDARVSSDGELSWPNVKFSPTDDDPAAMDVARALSDEEDIVGITIGDGKPEWAAARGASSTMIVEDCFGGSDGFAAASSLSAAIVASGADVATIGDSEWDRGVVSALAGELGWNAYAGVIAAEPDGDGVKLTIKSTEGNVLIRATTPLLLACQATAQEKNVPGMKQILAARKKPVEKTSISQLGAAVEGRSSSLGTCLPEGNRAILFDGSDPDTAVSQLLDALRGEGIL